MMIFNSGSGEGRWALTLNVLPPTGFGNTRMGDTDAGVGIPPTRVVSVVVGDGVKEGIGVGVEVPVHTVVGVNVSVGDAVNVKVLVGLSVGVPVSVGTGDSVNVRVGEFVSVGVSDGVGVADGIAVAVIVTVGVGVPVSVREGVEVLAPLEKCDGGRSKSVTPPASHTPFGVWSLVNFVSPSFPCS